jgi:hypothetical protein
MMTKWYHEHQEFKFPYQNNYIRKLKTRKIVRSKNIKSRRVVKFHPKYVKHLRNVREKLTGERSRLDRRLLDNWAQKSYALEQLVKERLVKTDLSKLSEVDKKQHFKSFLADMAFIFTGTRPKKPLQFLIDGITNALKNPDKHGFLVENTKIRLYSLYMSRIVDKIVSSNKQLEVYRYFNSAKEQELIIISQQGYQLSSESEIILKKYKKVTQAIFKKYLELYKTLSEFMEKMVFQLYSILKILRGEPPVYRDAAEYKLRNNYDYLKKDRDFSLLVKPLSVTIRNSLAHGRKYYVGNDSMVFRNGKRRSKKVT